MRAIKFLMAILFSIAVAACGNGGGTTVTPGTVSGIVTNAANSSGVEGVLVSAGNKSTTTVSGGAYTLSGASPASSVTVTFTKTGFVPQSRTTTAYTTASSLVSVSVPMLAVAYTATFDPTVAKTISDPNSTAQVQLPAGGLRTANGDLPFGNVTAQITPIDPANNLGTMPGNYLASQSGSSVPIESFGAINVMFTDASGNALTNLAAGKTAIIRIPVSSLPGQTPPNFIPLFFFNTSTGLWVQEGTATLKGTAPNQYYEGSVTHFSFWNADQILDTITYTSCVKDVNGNPVAGASVTSTGTNYTGTASTTTDANGNFTVAVKSNASATIQAMNGNVVSVALAITTLSANITVSTTCLALTTPATGTLTIVKNAQPDDPQDFHFTTLGTGLSAFDLDDDGTNANPLSNSKTFTLAAGVPFTVSENAVSGWTVDSIQCTDAAATSVSPGVPGPLGASIFTDPLNGTFTVILRAGSNVTCTFVNVTTTTGTGTLTIVKDAQPNSPQDFHFTTSGTGLSAFDLDDDPTNTTLPNTKTFINLAAGVPFTVTEDAVSGWTVPSLQCVPAVLGSATTTTDQLNRTFTVNLAAGANVTCTFINENLTNPTPFTATGGPTLQVSTIAMIPTVLQTSTDFTSTISGNSGTANVTAGPLGTAPDSIFTLSSSPTQTTLVGAVATLPSSILLTSGAVLSMTATSLWNTIPLASADFGMWAITNDIPNQPPSPVPVMTYSAYAGGTLTSAMPTSGTVIYTGKMTGVLANTPIGGSDDVSGNVTLTVDFTNGTINGLFTTISNVAGVSTLSGTTAFSGTFADITLSGGIVSGNSFSATIATTSIPGATNMIMNGSFYGATANEIAGTFTISEPSPGMILIGSFGAK